MVHALLNRRVKRGAGTEHRAINTGITRAPTGRVVMAIGCRVGRVGLTPAAATQMGVDVGGVNAPKNQWVLAGEFAVESRS